MLASAAISVLCKHRDSKLRFGELLPVSVAFKTSHTALEADCPGNSGTKQEVPFTKLILESHPLVKKNVLVVSHALLRKHANLNVKT